jgi:Protein of unknown function (DUF3109)
MIIIGETLVSEELFENHFVCDLNACKGACCIEGDSGAPLEAEELTNLEEVWEMVKPYMRPEGIKAIEELGLYQMDGDGDLVTTLVDGNKECAFVIFDSSGVAKCALENAYNDGKTNWKKPISCHLYPVRLQQLTAYMAVNYHRWGLCDPACALGSQLKVPIFKFLKEPLIRKFGEAWYEEAELVYTAMQSEKP